MLARLPRYSARMNILLVRHGETTWNREGRYQGRTDIPLSHHGQAQVRALGDRLRETPISVAIASPLSRAKTTAEAILASQALDSPTLARPQLELGGGL